MVVKIVFLLLVWVGLGLCWVMVEVLFRDDVF